MSATAPLTYIRPNGSLYSLRAMQKAMEGSAAPMLLPLSADAQQHGGKENDASVFSFSRKNEAALEKHELHPEVSAVLGALVQRVEDSHFGCSHSAHAAGKKRQRADCTCERTCCDGAMLPWSSLDASIERASQFVEVVHHDRAAWRADAESSRLSMYSTPVDSSRTSAALTGCATRGGVAIIEALLIGLRSR